MQLKIVPVYVYIAISAGILEQSFFLKFGGSCHSFFIYFVFFSYIHNHMHTVYIHSYPFAEASLLFFIAFVSLRGKNFPGVPSRDLNSGLPNSRPAH
jgi:hypothetical protein